MEDVALLGTPEDMATRSKTRVDDEARVKRISIARNAVYNGGKSLQSKTIEKYLKMGSYTLTEVNLFSSSDGHWSLMLLVECLFEETKASGV